MASIDEKERVMDLRATPNLVHLSEAGSGHRFLELAPARGQRVIVMSGQVWITQSGDVEDHVLRSGESLTLASPGVAMVSAFGTADVEVVPAPAPATSAPLPEFTADAYDRARRDAHQLRAEAMREMFAAAGAWIRGLTRRWLLLG
jgi:hypothetical protein